MTVPAAPGTLVAMYHYIRPADPRPGITALTPDDFDRQLAWLAGARRVIGFEEWSAALLARTACDGTALLTFDDGFGDHYEVAFDRLRARGWSGVFFLAGATLAAPPRVLNVHKTHLLMQVFGAEGFATRVGAALRRLPATVAAGGARTADVYRYDAAATQVDVKHLLNYELEFATADRVLSDLFAAHVGDEAEVAGRLYLTREQIREMAAAGMTFGFHTEKHRVMSRLTAAEQHAEVAGGVALVRELTRQTAVPFCFPYGHVHTYNEASKSALAAAGYAAAFTTVRRLAQTQHDDRFEIPRFDTRDLPPWGAHA